MQWKTISKDVAVEHPLYGFGGWLLTLWILFLISQLINIFTILGFNDGTLRSTYGYGSVGWLKASSAVTIILGLPFLILAPMRHEMMPKITIIALWIGVFGAFIFTWQALSSLGFSITVSMVNIITASLLTWYLIMSKRVNITYRHRIPDTAST